MSQIALAIVGLTLIVLALRVAMMRGRSLPFLIAYPVFVVVLVGGSVAVFLGASWGAAALGLDGESPLALAGIYGATLLAAG